MIKKLKFFMKIGIVACMGLFIILGSCQDQDTTKSSEKEESEKYDLTLLEDFEDGDNANLLGGEFYTFNDTNLSEPDGDLVNLDPDQWNGSSIVVPETRVTGAFNSFGEGYNSTKSARITYEIHHGDPVYPFAFAGMGMNFLQVGDPDIEFFFQSYKPAVRKYVVVGDVKTMDLTEYDGIRFMMRAAVDGGATPIIDVQISTIPTIKYYWYGHFFKTLSAANGIVEDQWIQIDVRFSQLNLYGWAKGKFTGLAPDSEPLTEEEVNRIKAGLPLSEVLKEAIAIQIQVSSQRDGETGYIEVDDIYLYKRK